ncbi:hypothetical protein [Paenibacillus humicola]|uniref:hypothetical protein n=1 Tax=Paenibacillus humicola TaxID=3110540 RepID=UPI00237BFF6A|nr:hypothetical protein [Paenibacillus humicola]
MKAIAVVFGAAVMMLACSGCNPESGADAKPGGHQVQNVFADVYREPESETVFGDVYDPPNESQTLAPPYAGKREGDPNRVPLPTGG